MHLIIIGGGSAAATGMYRALGHGATVTLVADETDIPLGGTCLNVGCVPSKFMIRAAESVHRMQHARHPGITPPTANGASVGIDFATLSAARQALIDELRTINYTDNIPTLDGVRLVRGRGTLGEGTSVEVNGETIHGDAVLIATGSRSHLPAIPGLAESEVLTSETVWDLKAAPERLVVLGGGYIAVEVAQMMSRLGSRVTVLQRSGHLLSDQSEHLGKTLSDAIASDTLEIRCGVTVESVGAGGVITSAGAVPCDAIFAALGRRGNSEGVPDAALVDARGFVPTDSVGRTPRPGVYAAGDVTGDPQFVYVASYAAEIAIDHACTGEVAEEKDFAALPWVVFTDPQVAGLGLDEETARAKGLPVEVAKISVGRWPRFRVDGGADAAGNGWLRLIRNPEIDQLLGARAVCPEAGDLVSELSLVMRHGIPASALKHEFRPYLTMTEGIGRAAQKFS